MNYPQWALRCLDLTEDAGTREVRRRYSELLKLNRPEDNPEGFQQLRAAYELCLAVARRREQQQVDAEAGMHAGSADTEPAAAAISAAATDTTTTTAAAPCSAAAAQALAHGDFAATTQPLQASHDTLPPEHLPAVSVPDLREPAVVVDELQEMSHRGAQAFAEWLAACPELIGLHTRDAVEMELLQRLLDGVRFGAAAIPQLSAAFGWRQVGFERRLREQGLSPRQQAQLLDALLQTQAEAEFEAHLAAAQPLDDRPGWQTPAALEATQLRWLHAQRDRVIPFWRAMPLGAVERYHRLIGRYAKRYGARSALAVFGHGTLAFWSRLHPENGMNWQLFSLRISQFSAAVWAVYLPVILLAFVLLAFAPVAEQLPRWKAMGNLSTLLLLRIWPAGLALISAHALLRGYAQLREVLIHRRQILLRRTEKWLAPARALPLQLLLGSAFLGVNAAFGTVAVIACAAAVCLLFGVPALVNAALIGMVSTVFLQPTLMGSPLLMPLVASIGVLVAWGTDWLGRRAAARRAAAPRP